MSDFEEIDIVTLTDEEGNEVEFMVLDTIEHEGHYYVVLQDPEEEDLVVILEEQPINEEESNYLEVEDEELAETIFKKFEENWEE